MMRTHSPNQGGPLDNYEPLPTNSSMLFICPECGLHYRAENTAKKCQAWCEEHHSCNLGIIAYAEENKPK